mmetsp:Transcript_44062/g.64752  ORF Transcript_44062/g.64752 Transcript_44062/m.64752 type:complete len:85 (+) Transcript_44062:2061-2315(+)
MGAYLMDYMVSTIRLAALQRIVRVYRPSIETKFILSELGFDEMHQGKRWMQSCGCVFSQDGVLLLAKETNVHASTLATQKNSLI